MRLSSAYLNLTREMTTILTMYGRRTGNNGDVGSSSSSPYILTAGAASHGFAPKVGSSSRGKKRGVLECIKSTIPDAFLALAKETARSITSSGGKILLYERRGWTFHAKGIWITADGDDGDDDGDDDDVDRSAPPPRRRRLDPRHHRPEIISDPSSLLATVIGSSNYGSRSENLDLESNCILIFNDDSSMEAGGGSVVKESVAAEWNELCRPSSVMRDVGDDEYGSNRVMRVVLKLVKRYL